MAERYCEFLGLENDPSTYSTYSSLRNHCHRARPPQVVNLSYQRSHCTTADYESCPIFNEEWKGKLPIEIRAKRKNPILPRWGQVLIVVGVILLGTLGAIELDWLPIEIQWTNPTATSMFIAAPPVKTAVPSESPPASPTLPPSTATEEMATVTPTPFPTTGPALETPFGPEGRYLIHRVVDGESYGLLEQNYNTSEAVIKATNILIAETELWPGTNLVILPGVRDPQGLPLLKVVYLDQPMDLDAISREYGISHEVLCEYNSMKEADLIHPGRWLIIPQARE